MSAPRILPPASAREPSAALLPGNAHGEPMRAADAARRAALAFVNEVASPERAGGDRAVNVRLAHWLLGPYREATLSGAAAPSSDARRDSDAAPPRTARMPSGDGALDRKAARIVSEARHHVVRALAKPRSSARLAIWARATDAVLPATVGGGTWEYRPVDHARMRLEDRVLSLFAADALVRPADYEWSVHVCPQARHVFFGSPEGCPVCAAARPTSEVSLRVPTLCGRPAARRSA